ncbi:MAG: Zn-ribbon domain-containing OB-fold protein [Desertimonas sp.]
MSGLGTVYAVTVVHRPPSASFADIVPYAFAIVDLDEGPRTVTIITGCDPSIVRPGQRVEASIDPPSGVEAGRAPLVFFRPLT